MDNFSENVLKIHKLICCAKPFMAQMRLNNGWIQKFTLQFCTN